MGYEFIALTVEGIIYNQPGMLINYSGGEWPLGDETEPNYQAQLQQMLQDSTHLTRNWDDFDNDELQEILDELLEDVN